MSAEIIDSYPLIIAHRGDSSHAPENTLAAFILALEKGADGVEFDVQLSSDGIPVVIHDFDLRRVAGRNESVSDLTAAALGKIDVGSWFNRKNPKKQNPDFPRQSVPTLVEVLALLNSSKGPVYIELKCRDSDYSELAKAVCEAIRDSPQLDQMIVKSFKLAAIPIVRCQLPEVLTAALFAPEIMHFLRHKRHIVTMARELGAHQISIHHSLAGRKLTTLASEASMPVTIWTADNPKWIGKCRSRGIGALITNDPAKLLAARDASR